MLLMISVRGGDAAVGAPHGECAGAAAEVAGGLHLLQQRMQGRLLMLA
jgi:hypothetical protein